MWFKKLVHSTNQVHAEATPLDVADKSRVLGDMLVLWIDVANTPASHELLTPSTDTTADQPLLTTARGPLLPCTDMKNIHFILIYILFGIPQKVVWQRDINKLKLEPRCRFFLFLSKPKSRFVIIMVLIVHTVALTAHTITTTVSLPRGLFCTPCRAWRTTDLCAKICHKISKINMKSEL